LRGGARVRTSSASRTFRSRGWSAATRARGPAGDLHRGDATSSQRAGELDRLLRSGVVEDQTRGRPAWRAARPSRASGMRRHRALCEHPGRWRSRRVVFPGNARVPRTWMSFWRRHGSHTVLDRKRAAATPIDRQEVACVGENVPQVAERKACSARREQQAARGEGRPRP
jgi:hypothetical protein